MIENLLITAVTIFLYMLIFYIIAQVIKNNSIVDIAWGPGFITVSIVLLLYTSDSGFHPLLLSSMVFIWGSRLAIHIYRRNAGKPEDFRYANWRKKWGRKAAWIAFYKVFMLQGLVMLILSIPLIFAFSSEYRGINIFNYAGIVIFLAGFLTEAVADRQMTVFKKDPSNKGKIIRTGLWKYSRHPNYFGEALLWWGIYLASAGSGYEYISIISPLLITLLLRYGSGVPMLEEKYRRRDDFREYASHTPVFVPFIGKKGLL